MINGTFVYWDETPTIHLDSLEDITFSDGKLHLDNVSGPYLLNPDGRVDPSGLFSVN